MLCKYNTALFTDVASGGAADWALGTAEVPYSYSMELRDTGRYSVGWGLVVWSGHRHICRFTDWEPIIVKQA